MVCVCESTLIYSSLFVSPQPKLLVSELIEMACSHCKINNERKYFGLKVPYERYTQSLYSVCLVSVHTFALMVPFLLEMGCV